MTDEDWKGMGLSTDEELEESFRKIYKMEEDGVLDTQKYFDRIHDKLFNLNNILIASYFALIAFRQDTTPNWILIIPVANTLMLLNIDYRMMIRARIQADISNADAKKRQRYGKIQTTTNMYSLLSIYSTIAVVLIFCYFLLDW